MSHNHPPNLSEWIPKVKPHFSAAQLRKLAITAILTVQKTVEDDCSESVTPSGIVIPKSKAAATSAEIRRRYDIVFNAMLIMRRDLGMASDMICKYLYYALRRELAGVTQWPDEIRTDSTVIDGYNRLAAESAAA